MGGREANASGDSAIAPSMIGSSPAMRQLRERIAQIAATDETVLICGESGTGKELVARSDSCARAGARLARWSA